MKIKTYLLFILPLSIAIGCTRTQEKAAQDTPSEVQPVATEPTPKEMLAEAYQLFKLGDDDGSIALANRVLEIGRETNNDTLIGRALTSLCRNSQRGQDTARLAELSAQLVQLAQTSGNKQWLMYMAHMNAEMWRLIGDLDSAEAYYNKSLAISKETGAIGMYTIDHFNKSFVSIDKGDFETAKALIRKYYQLRKENGLNPDDAYGLIALAYLLEQQGNYEGAHEVATVTRRLFKEQNIFPEPPDEKPLKLVETKVKKEVSPRRYIDINYMSENETVSSLLEKYLDPSS